MVTSLLGLILGLMNIPVVQAAEIQTYDIGLSHASAGSDAFISKGGAVPGSGYTGKVINYEQAFALNSNQASYASSRGWLATTCDGQEISPQNIPDVKLLDARIAAARDWRAGEIAAETTSKRAQGTYLDTLRAFWPDGFYDGTPCNNSDAAWNTASVELVKAVKAKTGGFVIANGAGLGSGNKYIQNQAESDKIINVSDGVQIEQWMSNPENADADKRFMQMMIGRGKMVFAKCKSALTTCQNNFIMAPLTYLSSTTD